MNNNHLSLGQKLRLIRQLKELSVEEFAELLNVNKSLISAWENEEMRLTKDDLIYISEHLNMPLSMFTSEENEEDYVDEDYEEDYDEYDKEALVNKVIEKCKEKLIKDGIEVKEEYLPQYDAYNEQMVSYGLFDIEYLPIVEEEFEEYDDVIDIDESVIDEDSSYVYVLTRLISNGLYDFVKDNYQDEVLLTDLFYCDDLELFEMALDNEDINDLQDDLNELLENLDPELDNFWEIIVFLIDNGAYYIKDTCNYYDYDEDISKTNIVYRIAKDKIEQ